MNLTNLKDGSGAGGGRGAPRARAPRPGRPEGSLVVKLFDWLLARAGPRPPLAEQTRDWREEGAGRGAGGATLARAAF